MTYPEIHMAAQIKKELNFRIKNMPTDEDKSFRELIAERIAQDIIPKDCGEGDWDFHITVEAKTMSPFDKFLTLMLEGLEEQRKGLLRTLEEEQRAKQQVPPPPPPPPGTYEGPPESKEEKGEPEPEPGPSTITQIETEEIEAKLKKAEEELAELAKSTPPKEPKSKFKSSRLKIKKLRIK